MGEFTCWVHPTCKLKIFQMLTKTQKRVEQRPRDKRDCSTDTVACWARQDPGAHADTKERTSGASGEQHLRAIHTAHQRAHHRLQ